MAKIDAIEAGHYRIPLDTALSDSTHGTMTAFELITVRVCDSDGAQGVGYTYTTGHNGAAIHATFWPTVLSRSSPARMRPDRAPLEQGLVGSALRRARRCGRARAIGVRHCAA